MDLPGNIKLNFCGCSGARQGCDQGRSDECGRGREEVGREIGLQWGAFNGGCEKSAVRIFQILQG